MHDVVLEAEVEDAVVVADFGRGHAEVVRVLEEAVGQGVLAQVHAIGHGAALAVAGDQHILARQVMAGGVVLDRVEQVVVATDIGVVDHCRVSQQVCQRVGAGDREAHFDQLAAVVVLAEHPGLGAEYVLALEAAGKVEMTAVDVQLAGADFAPALGQGEGVAFAQDRPGYVVERPYRRYTAGVGGKVPGI